MYTVILFMYCMYWFLDGHLQAIQTDIVMDVGKSLNPAIDIGQIEGAFVQVNSIFMSFIEFTVIY